MAHIVTCMLEGELENSPSGYLVRPASPQVSKTGSADKAAASPSEKPFAWRMHQPEARRYQLFPRDKQMPSAPGKGLDPEQAFALVMSKNGDKMDKSSPANGLRLRIMENNLTRRRKVSVPELGPMTTVQEASMDSPTIPGRPPLHERSISAPGHSYKPHRLAECMIAPTILDLEDWAPLETGADEAKGSVTLARQAFSPKNLAPLVIPSQAAASAPKLARQPSLSHIRPERAPLDVFARPARTDESPMTKTPFTPLSASTTQVAPSVASTLPTPISAPVESRSSPMPWAETVSTPLEEPSDPRPTPKAEAETRPPVTAHRRNQSESGSIMDRGRPRKRGDTVPVGAASARRAASKQSKSAERRAFETLPKGWRAADAVSMLSQNDVAVLQKQAAQQAARFEILRKEDVDGLSRELRHLDERAEYLRRTYQSLRAGRRNLHSRICQYLRSARTAKFSHDSMLKQEEALAELDASIDDWVAKLDQAENRRVRVRQKLLEHVAAAVTLPSANVAGFSESLQLAMGTPPPAMSTVPDVSTPPRSPTKSAYTAHTQSSSPSPQRVVAQVPSTILEQPIIEEAAGIGLDLTLRDESASAAAAGRRPDVESIRIYAGDDVYALFADVENEISKMSGGEVPRDDEEESPSEEKRRELHRAHSQELLSGIATKAAGTSTPRSGTPPAKERKEPKEAKEPLPGRTAKPAGTLTPRSGTPPAKDRKDPKNQEGEILLTSAVFRPEKSTLLL